MQNKNMQTYRRIYKILLSISIITAGICLIVGCASIYFSGNGYSREFVRNVFSKINIPIYLSLAIIAGDIIWEIISPFGKNAKPINKKSVAVDRSNSNSTINKKALITKLSILIIAVALIVFGFSQNGFADVLTKAVNICTECIGLG